jgi:hypothetical protein
MKACNPSSKLLLVAAKLIWLSMGLAFGLDQNLPFKLGHDLCSVLPFRDMAFYAFPVPRTNCLQWFYCHVETKPTFFQHVKLDTCQNQDGKKKYIRPEQSWSGCVEDANFRMCQCDKFDWWIDNVKAPPGGVLPGKIFQYSRNEYCLDYKIKMISSSI